MARPLVSSEPMTPIAAADGGFEQVTIGTTAGTLASFLTAGIPSDARHCIFYPETNALRWRADGTAPTVAVGTPMAADVLHVFENQRPIFDNMRVIAEVAATLVNIQFFK